MIGYEVKRFVEDIIKKHAYKVGDKAVKIVQIKPDEDKFLADKQLPFVSLLSADGKVDERMGKTIQYPRRIPESLLLKDFNTIRSGLQDVDLEILEYSYTEKTKGVFTINDLNKEEHLRVTRLLEQFGYNKMYQSTIRGAVEYPLEIRAFAKNELHSNTLLLDIIRNIPDTWVMGEYSGKIMIENHGSSDWASNLRDFYLSYCFVHFFMDIGTDPVEIPTINYARNIRG